MNDYNEQMTAKIVEILSQVALKATNLPDDISIENCLLSFFNLTPKELEIVVNYVVENLPQRLYLDKYLNVKIYAQELIAKELLLFLAQEDKKSAEFPNNLKNFRAEINNELINNVYVLDEEMKQGADL